MGARASTKSTPLSHSCTCTGAVWDDVSCLRRAWHANNIMAGLSVSRVAVKYSAWADKRKSRPKLAASYGLLVGASRGVVGVQSDRVARPVDGNSASLSVIRIECGNALFDFIGEIIVNKPLAFCWRWRRAYCFLFRQRLCFRVLQGL